MGLILPKGADKIIPSEGSISAAIARELTGEPLLPNILYRKVDDSFDRKLYTHVDPTVFSTIVAGLSDQGHLEVDIHENYLIGLTESGTKHFSSSSPDITNIMQ